MISDIMNAAFELFAVFALGNHCRVLMKHKSVRGTSILSVCFFAAWGFWNLYYYPSLGQLFSFWASVALCFVHGLYIYLLVKFSRPILTGDGIFKVPEGVTAVSVHAVGGLSADGK